MTGSTTKRQAGALATLALILGAGAALAQGDTTAVQTATVEAADPARSCEPDAETICLQDSRYQVRGTWRSPEGDFRPAYAAGVGTNDTGLFSFHGTDNWEVLVKVLDGCAINGKDWVFAASATTLGFDIEVTDTLTGAVREYGNEPGLPAAAVTDTNAFTDRCANRSEEITIGVVVALTGHHAEPYGLPMQRGFELAREEINNLGDPRLAFVTVDDMSTPDGAKAAVRRLVNQKVPAIVGLAISTHLREAAPIAQENEVIAFSSVSSASGLSAIGDFVFRTSLATDISLPSGVTATQEILGYTKVATIYDRNDVYSTNSNDVLRMVLGENRIEILTEEEFETGDTDFSEQLARIVAVDPDALFISALSQEIAGILSHAARLGLPGRMHIIAPDLTMAEVRQAGPGAEGTIGFIGWSSRSDAPGNQAFVRNYRARYGIEPEPWAAQSYATLHVLANAIRTARSGDPAAIRDALAQTRDYPTILGRAGRFSFNPDGDALYDQILVVVRDGALEFLE